MMKTYSNAERQQFDPGPCPRCGGSKVRVNWIDAHTSADPPDSVWVPGSYSCLNPDCR